jgi:hypothetical protein
MTRNLQSILAGGILLLSILACNRPLEQVVPPGEVQTAAALTLQAIFTPSLVSTAPAATLGASSTPRVTLTAATATTGSATTAASQTPTYSVPLLTVQESTNCRTGPGEDYEIVFTYLTGKELEIVGRYDPGNFWLVKSNESPSGTCWLWGEYVEVAGSYWAVSSVTPPPTATGAPPRGPGIDKWEFSCSGGALTFTVIWVDNANNETSYRIFRNGEQIIELPPDTTTYTDVYPVSPDQRVEYFVQAFSPAGTANSSVMPMRCGTT